MLRSILRAPVRRVVTLILTVVASALLAAGAGGSRSSPAATTTGFAAAAPALTGDRSSSADTTVVSMTNGLEFSPDSVRIRTGATVVWKNTSVLVHTVTAVEDSAADPADVRLPEGAEPFGSDRLGPDETYRHTFTVPGTYRYVCLPHEAAGMTGTVVVEEAD